MMYFGFIVFIALIWYSFSVVNAGEDEKMKKKGFVRVSSTSKPELGVQVQLLGKQGWTNHKYSRPNAKVSVMPETYVLFEVDGELIWVPPVSHHQILAFEQGKYYKPNPNPTQVLKYTYTKGDTKYKTLSRKSYRKGTRFESRGEW